MEYNISVAMATYNGAKYIEEQLLSIIQQTITPAEIIIVDDSSSDVTIEIIKRIQEDYTFIKLYPNKSNIGPIEAFKKAISLCSYDYVALSDQDDIWEKDKLEECFKALYNLDGNKPSIVFSDLKMIDTKGNLIANSFWNVQRYNPFKNDLKKLLIGNIVTGCTILMNRKMKDEIAKMPAEIIMHDYWIAIIAYSIGDFKVINDSLIKYRVHSNSVTLKSEITFSERLKLFLEVFVDRKKRYLSENIKQTEIFFNMYQNDLSSDKFQLVKKFISLKNRSSIYRKIYVFHAKYLSA